MSIERSMSLNRLESYLYGDDIIGHAVIAYFEGDETIFFTIAPWPQSNDSDPDLNRKKVVTFDNAVVKYRRIEKEGAILEFPWDIIGFDSYDLGNDNYEFVLICTNIEIVFESFWPKLLNNK